ncbi:hypothetical protein VCV18_003347 [Metarhizium anisopliae]
MAGHVAGEKNEVKLLPVDGWWCIGDTADARRSSLCPVSIPCGKSDALHDDEIRAGDLDTNRVFVLAANSTGVSDTPDRPWQMTALPSFPSSPTSLCLRQTSSEKTYMVLRVYPPQTRFDLRQLPHVDWL